MFSRRPLHCSCPGENSWITCLELSIFSKTADLEPATLLKMNSYIGFYQGSLELNMLTSPEEEVELAQLSSLSDKLTASTSKQMFVFCTGTLCIIFPFLLNLRMSFFLRYTRTQRLFPHDHYDTPVIPNLWHLCTAVLIRRRRKTLIKPGFQRSYA